MMAYMKMRWVYISLMVLGVFCLYYNLEDLNPFKGEPVIFKNELGDFLQLPDIDCEQDPPFLILLVASSHEQWFVRLVIRSTWGREKIIKGKRIKTLFLLGTSPSKHISREVAKESQKFRDIIQKNFTDDYFNLTLKTMMGMQWIYSFCPQTTFVMKTDSDMFVNIYYLTELLLKKNRTTRFFTGFLKLNEYPIRKRFNKWFVSKYEYPWDKYPPFCSGTGYVFSSDVAGEVYHVANSVPFIKLEDVFVGLCLKRLKIRLEELHSEQTFFPDGLPFTTCRYKKIVASHHIKPRDILKYWQALEGSLPEECPDN
ncbi:beta-1,3-galactosyltransferase 5 isoform X1 [Bubalus bubalis]|uniref:beta-1,3-galactosyltransferase 5 isoform X1 n=2 Tax=Bubalus TaxID=9918 RepID=UPI00042CE81A|nr:beta-1,3-galactosyltransferase 5 isoform X1 [Bubalus bubalis]